MGDVSIPEEIAIVKSLFERAKRLRERLIKETAERDLLRASLEAEVSAKNASDSRHEAACKARAILQTVAQETQKNLEYRVANIVTLALAAEVPTGSAMASAWTERLRPTTPLRCVGVSV